MEHQTSAQAQLEEIRQVDQQIAKPRHIFGKLRAQKHIARRHELIAHLQRQASLLKDRLRELKDRATPLPSRSHSWLPRFMSSRLSSHCMQETNHAMFQAEQRDLERQLLEISEVLAEIVSLDDDVGVEEPAEAGETIEAHLLGKLQEVHPDTSVWKSVTDLVEERSKPYSAHYRGMKMRVTKVWRVPENESFRSMEEQVAVLGTPTKLFHGSAVANMGSIISNGFELPRRPGMFGRGIYFAETPLKSVSYTRQESQVSRIRGWFSGNRRSSGGRQMLLCDVYLGRPLTLRRAQNNLIPEIDLKGGCLSKFLHCGDYDSVYAPGSGSMRLFSSVRVSEYIVYKPQQAIPKYLIEFELL